MTKHATGGAFTTRGRHFLRVTIDAGKRQAVAVPWATSREAALERARVVQALVDRLRSAGHADLVPKVVEAAAAEDAARLEAIGRAVDGLLAGELVKATPKPEGPAPVTLSTFADDWTEGRLALRFPDHCPRKEAPGAAADARVFRRYINPVIGALPLAAVTLEDADRVLAVLPEHLSTVSRRHVAQALRRVLELAVYPARHLRESPIPKGWLPKIKRPHAFTFVYPDEDKALLAHAEIPLVRRLFFGVLAREGMRRDELAGLRWADVDLARGMVALLENKTDDPRAWALAPDVVRALAKWKERQGEAAKQPGALVFGVGARPLYVLKMAEQLRADLEAAGVTRAELFERSATRRPVRVHDLRASFVTVSLANGRSESWVADRTGHRSSEMINRYRRAARTWAEAGLGTFAPLDEALAWREDLPSRCRVTAADAAAAPGNRRERRRVTSAERRGFEPLVPLRVHMISKSVPWGTLADSRMVSGPVEDEGGPSGPPLPRPLPRAGGVEEVGQGGAEAPPVASSGASGEALGDGAIGDRDDRDGKPEKVSPELGAGPSSAHRGGADDGAEEPRDVVHALALALERASRAGRWDVVAQLGRELEARRLEAEPNVVSIGTKRRDRR